VAVEVALELAVEKFVLPAGGVEFDEGQRGVGFVIEQAGSKAEALVERVRLDLGLGERTQGLRQDPGHQVPANGDSALAQGAVGHVRAGDLFHVSGEIAGRTHDMENLGHQPLPAREFGQARAARTKALCQK
jgi:hypothetical protein